MSHRKMTPKGQMASNGSGPAIMMMPPHIRATFMPDPPLKHLPPPKKKYGVRYVSDGEKGNSTSTTTTKSGRPKIKGGLTGLSAYLPHFERTATPPERKVGPTPSSTKAAKRKKKLEANQTKIEPIISDYRKEQLDCGGEFEGMNCYNTLFVGRLAYEVTERKLLREFEVFGPVKDLKIVYDTSTSSSGGGKNEEDGSGGGGEKKSRGYAFVEYEHEDDMKRAYRNADGMRVEGRCVVVDVERGHTVLNWLPRRLGGGLGGTRIGGKDKNVTAPGRFDPSKPQEPPQHPMMGPPGGGPGGPPPGYGGGPPPPGYGGPPGPPGDRGHPMMRGGGPGGSRGGPPPPGRGGMDGPGYRGGPPPPGYGGGPYGPPRGGPGGPYSGGPRGGPGGGDYYGGGPGGPGGFKRRRSRSRSPEQRRRGRY